MFYRFHITLLLFIYSICSRKEATFASWNDYNIYKIHLNHWLQENIQIIHSIIIILNEIEIEQNVIKLNLIICFFICVLSSLFGHFMYFIDGAIINGVLRSMYGLELLNQSNLILLIRFLQIVYQEKHDINYYENIAMCTWKTKRTDLCVCNYGYAPLSQILRTLSWKSKIMILLSSDV